MIYHYIAKDKNDQEVTGEIEANSEIQGVLLLVKKDFKNIKMSSKGKDIKRGKKAEKIGKLNWFLIIFSIISSLGIGYLFYQNYELIKEIKILKQK